MTPPSLPLVDSSQLADAGSLATLKRAAASNDPRALREAARQFESLFTSMMLKSMQEANFKDPLFGSDQGDLYQQMYDDQVAAEMSKGKGLGLADMLVQQLRRTGIDRTAPDATISSKPTGDAPVRPIPGTTQAGAGRIIAAGEAVRAAGTRTTDAAISDPAETAPAGCPSSAQQAAFAHALWPEAEQAARRLGVSPVTLLAQAALETDWGRSVPRGAGGGTSHNLFGIKATSAWSGRAVSSSTQEYSGGRASTVQARFRSYDSTSQCFQDYVSLLESDPRYAAALGTGNDIQAFGSALQEGGYATDPRYAGKLTAVAGTLSHALARTSAAAPASGSLPSLKFAADLPITDGGGTLQRR